MKTGVILARFQPLHNGHMALIKMACEENERVLILVGSADKFNKRNPIPIDIRLAYVKEAIEAEGLSNKVVIQPLDDYTSEEDNSHDWGFYLYAYIVNLIGQSTFTMYYSDGYELFVSWFPQFVMAKYVSVKLLARAATVNGLSATEVRNKILKCEDVRDLVPASVDNRIELIRSLIKGLENTK